MQHGSVVIDVRSVSVCYWHIHMYSGVVRVCVRERPALMSWISEHHFYPALYGIRTTFGHILPCILLVAFTIKLVRAISRADRRHAYLLSSSSRSIRSNSTTLNSTIANHHHHRPPPAQHQMSTTSIDNDDNEQQQQPLNNNNNNNNVNPIQQSQRRRWSKQNNERRMGGLKQNTRMLILIIALFLMTEIPAVILFTVHLCAVSFQFKWISPYYNTINILLIIR